MKVAHIVRTLAGTSIPVELASYLNNLPGIQSDIVSLTRSEEIPDIADPRHVAMNGAATARDVVDFIRAGRYTVVNTHHNAGSKESRQIAWMLTRAGIPVVDSQHGRLHYSRSNIYSNAVGMFLSRGVTFNSFCTAKAYTWPERLLFRRKPTRVIHLGVNTAVTERYRTRSTGQIRRISCAARLIRRKNHTTLLKAISHIRETGVSLDIVGGGPQTAPLIAEARELGIHDQVRFHGALRDREDVYRVLGESDLFVLPSLGEGFCVAVTEAMAIGLPTITSDIETFREVVGDSGLYVPAKDARALADQILALVEAPERARALGQANHERAVSLFAIDRAAEQFKDFYGYVLSRHERGSDS